MKDHSAPVSFSVHKIGKQQTDIKYTANFDVTENYQRGETLEFKCITITRFISKLYLLKLARWNIVRI
jgi:hypothetical protein